MASKLVIFILILIITLFLLVRCIRIMIKQIPHSPKEPFYSGKERKFIGFKREGWFITNFYE